MNDKFQNKYRIPSARWQNWDYRWSGAYFITICTQDREHFFGKVINEKMELSPLGILADVLWYEIKHHAKNLELGEFVVMPNHVHGILILTAETLQATSGSAIPANGSMAAETLQATSVSAIPANGSMAAETLQATSVSATSVPPPIKNEFFQKISPKSNSISAIVRSYKSAVSRHAHRLGFDEFHWQTRFHDHVIRNDEEYQRIAQYIVNNPQKWGKDKFNNK